MIYIRPFELSKIVLKAFCVVSFVFLIHNLKPFTICVGGYCLNIDLRLRSKWIKLFDLDKAIFLYRCRNISYAHFQRFTLGTGNFREVSLAKTSMY